MIQFLLYLFLSQSHAQPAPPGTPGTGGGTGQLTFTAATLPRICKECCFDILFALDRTTGALPAGDPSSWSLMKTIVGELAANPGTYNDPRVRTGIMQFGSSLVETDKAVLQTGSPKTGLRFGLTTGPFPEDPLRDYGMSDTTGLSTEADYLVAMKEAIKAFDAAGKPYLQNSGIADVCTEANFRKLIVWVTTQGLAASDAKSPCKVQAGDSSTVVSQLNEASGSNYVVGIHPAPKTVNEFDSLQCFWPAAVAFEDLIRTTNQFSLLNSDTDRLFAEATPCVECSYLDIVFLLDESSSLCNPGFDSDSGTVCGDGERDEWDQEVGFVQRVIQELAPTWDKHRVEVWTFADRAEPTNIKLQCSGGGGSQPNLANVNRPASSCGSQNPKSPEEVQAELNRIRLNFRGGQTSTADAVSFGMTVLEWAPFRTEKDKNGNTITPRKILVLVTDGGPNANYYDTTSASQGKRFSSPCRFSGVSATPEAWCLGQYSNRFYTAYKGTLNNFAVCTEAEDPNPPAVRWLFKDPSFAPNDKYQYIQRVGGQQVPTSDRNGNPLGSYPSDANTVGVYKSYAEALAELQIVPVLIEVGGAALNHKPDINCLLNPNLPGSGVLDAGTFTIINQNTPFREALLGAICRAVPLLGSTAALTASSTTNIFARWNQYTTWRNAYESQQIQFKEWLALQQQQNQQSLAPVTGSSLSGAAFGAVIGAGIMFWIGRKSRTRTDYTQLVDMDIESV